MKNKRLWEYWAVETLLKGTPLARLLSLMAAWWQGKTLQEVAEKHGITSQRVAAILAKVGCTHALWRRLDHGCSAPVRRASPSKMEEAWRTLTHPRASRLTPGQRGALAWKLSGLADVEIARRMAVSPSRVWQLRHAARAKLERLERKAAGTGRAGPPSGSRDGLAELLSAPLGLEDLGLVEADATGGADAHPSGGKPQGDR